LPATITASSPHTGSKALRSRFDRASRLADIDEAVSAGPTLREADLDEALGLARESVRVAAPDDPELSSYFSTLGTALIRKCQLLGSSRDLDDGINALRHALSLTAGTPVRTLIVRMARENPGPRGTPSAPLRAAT